MTTQNQAAGLAGLKDTAVILLATSLSIVGGLGVQSCLAWFLGPEGRGAYAVCLAFASVMAVVFSLGMDRAIQYHLLSKGLSLRESLVMALLVTFFGSVLAALVAWFLIKTPIPYFDRADRASFHVALAIIPILAATVALALLLEAQRRFKFVLITNIVAVALNLLLILALVIGMGWGVKGALLAMFWSGLATVCLQAALLFKMGGGLALPTPAAAQSVLAYGLRYYVARLGNVLNTQVGLIILALFASAVEIGLFAAASALIVRVTILPDALNKALQPRLGVAADGRPDLVAQSARAMFVLVGLGVGTVAVVSPLVVPILFSSKFSPCVPLLWIMATGVWFRGWVGPFMAYFIAVNRPGVVSVSTGSRFVVTTLVLLSLHLLMGVHAATAAAWAMTAGGIASALVLLVAFRAKSGRSFCQTWAPQLADFQRLSQLVRGALGKAEVPTRFDSLDQADLHWQGTDSRQAISLPDRFIKRQPSDLTRIELEKTNRGVELARRTGLFTVPTVLSSDVERGVLEMERIDRMVPLWEEVRRRRNADDIIIRVGRSLAAIHNDLTLPPSMAIALPDELVAGSDGPVVHLHGDFNGFNVLVRPQSGELVIIDWATSPRIDSNQGPGRTTVGPCYFDLSWFVITLFFRSYWGMRRIANLPKKVDLFVDSYFQTARHAGTVDEFKRYLRVFHEAGYGFGHPVRESTLDKILRIRHYRIATGALRSFIDGYTRSGFETMSSDLIKGA